MLTCTGFAAASPTTPLAPITFNRRDVGADDVQIEILYCGVCHSDLHFARDEWHFTVYPAVPGHEIIGRVTSVGAGVSKYKVGEYVGVGCMVDSCRTCPSCVEGLEQYCDKGNVGTYGGTEPVIGGPTFGGYSSSIVVDQSFVLRIPEGMDLASTAPLLCAGITLYSPLKHWGAGPGKKVGIIGLGGLGHMGVKLSHAMGAQTVLFTTSPGKVEDGKKLGAEQVVISKDAAQMAAHTESFDLIIDTVSASHDLTPYFNLLKREGTMVQVGAPEHPLPIAVFPLIMKRRNFAGSMIGGIAETQEMLDFCAARNITADVEIIPIQKINEAYERMLKSDVKYRFSIDMASLTA
ncbi:NAD(P)-dependent alcohol dehydrogenase [Acidocella sp.]|uniref:NAD(P)-dependent alcohol dehydrogenase n=1 Tax=Acidocella sp. TaxID=50710 RepID=UPI0017DFEF53|nr:NAD(P)-dependent alcohol dehydrogenase [Acidocella sp.]NNM56631.1 NAD(P)-dependent alcohol dehydrogenase [Acidocella sp.]